MKTWLPLLALVAALTGCSTSHSVIVNTGTVLGVAVAENPSTGMYEARFGYARTEFAYVPSNRPRGTNEAVIGQGAKDTANVLMEVRMENLLKGGLIYQRLAVGDVAVAQPGAALLFARSPDGKVDQSALQAVQSIQAPDPAVTGSTVPLASAFQASTNKEAFDAVARKNGFASFAAFLINPSLSADKVTAVTQDLRNLSLIP
jgi:hypothetical protein